MPCLRVNSYLDIDRIIKFVMYVALCLIHTAFQFILRVFRGLPYVFARYVNRSPHLLSPLPSV